MKAIISLLLLLPSMAFADPVNYSCDYARYGSPEGTKRLGEKFELDFIHDREADKSYMLGNNGSSQVTPIPGEARITFIEITKTKNVMTTTIDSQLNSVHSRNTIIAGELVPSQYYGTCDIK